MRNLILGILCLLLFYFSADAQLVKVEGYAGITGNYSTRFYGDYFNVIKNERYAVIDLSGKTMVSGILSPVVDFDRKLSIYDDVFFSDSAGGIVLKNVKGQTLSATKYMEIRPFVTDNTVAWVKAGPASIAIAYIGIDGKEIVRFDVKKYLSITDPQNKNAFAPVSLQSYLPFSEGLTPIRSSVSGKCGFINKRLQLAIPVSFKDACPFSDGLAAIQNEVGSWGFINTTGKLVIPCDYSQRPSRLMSGLARVQNKELHFGYINKENKVIIIPRYATATCFYKGFALVREGFYQPINLIDSTGAVVATFPKDLVYIDDSKGPAGISGEEAADRPFYIPETLRQLVDEGEGIFKKGLSYGVMDNKGKVVLDFKYQYLADLHKGKMFAHSSAFINNSTHNDMGIINDKGEWSGSF
jgi:WG repeat protein